MFKRKRHCISPSASLLDPVLVPRSQLYVLNCLNLARNLGFAYARYVIHLVSILFIPNYSLFHQGEIPLVVNVESADIMATLVNLKREHKDITGHDLRLTFSGATEAHILAKEIARAGISVILTSPRTYPGIWEQKRMQVIYIFSDKHGQGLLYFLICFGDCLDYRVRHCLSIVHLAPCWLKESVYLLVSLTKPLLGTLDLKLLG